MCYAVILDKLPKKPGVRFYTGEESEQREDEGEQVHVVALYGEDAERLEEVGDALEPLFAQLPGVLGIKVTGDPAPNELGLVVDRERTQQQGINPQVVAGVVGYALRGQTLNRYRTGGEDIPVRIRFREDDRETLQGIITWAYWWHYPSRVIEFSRKGLILYPEDIVIGGPLYPESLHDLGRHE